MTGGHNFNNNFHMGVCFITTHPFSLQRIKDGVTTRSRTFLEYFFIISGNRPAAFFMADLAFVSGVL